MTYLISVTNLGPSAATSVSVNESLSPDLTVLATNATQGAVSISNGALTWNLGTLAAGAKATLTIVASTTTNETLITTATVAATQADPNPANNTRHGYDRGGAGGRCHRRGGGHLDRRELPAAQRRD